jgi:hypothetical protein
MTAEEMAQWRQEEQKMRNLDGEKLKKEHPDWDDHKIQNYLNQLGPLYSLDDPQSNLLRKILSGEERRKIELLRADSVNFWTCRWLVTAKQRQDSESKSKSARLGSAVRRLIKLPQTEYQRRRDSEAKQLSISVEELDTAVAQKQMKSKSHS